MHRKLVVLVAALALVGAACGGGGDDETKTSATKKSTTTSEKSASEDLLGTDADGATSTTTKNGATGTTAKGRSSATTTKPGSPAPTTDPNAVPVPAAAGTYDYAQSGQVAGQPVPPDGTLVVSGGGPSQVFKRYFDTAEAPSDIYFTFRDDGPVITKVIVRQQGAAIACTFDAPVPAPPWPPTTGRTFSGHATCDNGFQADFNGSITGRATDSVGGKAVDTVVINSTLHIVGAIFGQAIDITVQDTQHWAPSLRVPTFSHEKINGNAGTQPISGEVTSTLKSTSPR